MRLIAIVFSLLILTLFPFVMQGGFAQCILTSPIICLDSSALSLKEQLGDNVLTPDIICPKYDHVLVERPNGKFACVTDHMAEKMRWHNISNIDDKNSTRWKLNGETIPIKLDNIVLDYIRAEHTHQKILMIITMSDNTQPGKIEFTFPKQVVSQIFDKENCPIFDISTDVPKFNLRVDQEFKGTLDAHYLAADRMDNLVAMTLSIHVSEDTSVIELFSTCDLVIPFLDKATTVSQNNDSVKYTVDGQATIINGTIVDNEYNLFLVTMNSSSIGNLVIELPRDVVDSKGDYCPPRLEFPKDYAFIVLANGEEIDFDEIFTTLEERILMIPFEKNTSEIEIVGSCLI